MNFTELYRAKNLITTPKFIIPPSIPKFIIPSEVMTSGWKGYALKVTVFAVGFGICILLLRKKGFGSGGRCNFHRKRKLIVRPGISKRDISTNTKVIGHSDKSAAVYNDEVCPICLEVPKFGVNTSCGHLLCAECLANYCKIRNALLPPPCPLCRAPLNSVTLACDFAILGPETPERDIITVRKWIRKYNKLHGLMTSVRRPLPTMRLALFFNILSLFLIVGLIAAKLQVFAEI